MISIPDTCLSKIFVNLLVQVNKKIFVFHPSGFSVSEGIYIMFQKTSNAQAILDYVFECLNIVEKDYFGLRYQDCSKDRVRQLID